MPRAILPPHIGFVGYVWIQFAQPLMQKFSGTAVDYLWLRMSVGTAWLVITAWRIRLLKTTETLAFFDKRRRHQVLPRPLPPWATT